jgi:hypothetical protein
MYDEKLTTLLSIFIDVNFILSTGSHLGLAEVVYGLEEIFKVT